MHKLKSAAIFALLASALPLSAHAQGFQTKRCMNMGNALDAPKEGDWGHTLDAQSFKIVADAGFDTVRIPVRWSAHTGPGPDYKIKEQFFNRVSQVIDQALAQDLNIVLNIHHFEELNEKPVENTAKFLALWGQIAPRYKDLPKSVYFEVINEPNGAFKGDLMRDIQRKGFAKIRESNPDRILIMGGDDWSGIRSLNTIPRIDDPNQVYTFHYYDPFNFTHQKAGWTDLKNSGRVNWGSDADKAELEAAVDTALNFQRQTGVPLFLGEIGAYEKAPYQDVVNYTRETRAAFETAGIGWCVWNFAATFPFYDKESGSWDLNKLAALGMTPTGARSTSPATVSARTGFTGMSLDDAFNALRRRAGRDGDLMMVPYPDTLTVYGRAKIKAVKDKDVPGGQAAEVKISRKGKNPWDAGVSGPIAGAVQAGDTLLMSYWAKTVKGDGVITNAGLQQNSAPYTALAAQPARPGTDWQQYYIVAKADRDYAGGEAGYSFQLAGARQTVRLGPVLVLNLGKGVDAGALQARF